MPYNILSRVKSKQIKALSAKKERDKTGLFIAEGEKCVRELLKGFSPECIIASKSWLSNNPGQFNGFEDIILESDKRGIEIISSQTSLPDVIGIFRKREEDEDLTIPSKQKITLLLDEIQDPGNLGTIIRTCDWLGIYEIFASRNTVDAYSPKVVQATMGSLSRVNVHYVALEDLLERNKDIALIGTLLNGIPIQEMKIKDRCMVLLGNEGRGISENLKRFITIPVTIPPANAASHPDSLNVAIAGAIVLAKLCGL